MARSDAEIELLNFLGDRVPAIQGRPVVVFIMAFDEPCGDPVQRPGTTIKGYQLVAHLNSPSVVLIVPANRGMRFRGFRTAPCCRTRSTGQPCREGPETF